VSGDGETAQLGLTFHSYLVICIPGRPCRYKAVRSCHRSSPSRSRRRAVPARAFMLMTKAGVRYKKPKSGKGRTVALSARVNELRSHRVQQAQELLKLGVPLMTDDTFVIAQRVVTLVTAPMSSLPFLMRTCLRPFRPS
jgi:hypothetical protein